MNKSLFRLLSCAVFSDPGSVRVECQLRRS